MHEGTIGRLARLAMVAALAACNGESIIGSSNDAAVAKDAPRDAGGPADVGFDAPDVSRCGPGQLECGGLCVSVAIDPGNCGACGRRCGDIERCVDGVCRVSCPGAQVACPVVSDAGVSVPTCVSIDTDRGNCGACGMRCAPGQVCSNGMCATTCAELLSTCADERGGAYCADLRRDPANCGTCGRGCAPGQTCEGARCVTTCSTGFTACQGAAAGDGGLDGAVGPGYCADLQTDRSNCGACGTACPSGQVCADGTCAVSCGAGTTACLGTCRDLQTDRANCGACGTVCPTGQVCSAGSCEVSCGAGLSSCAGVCRDLQTDRANCGVCGTACGAGQVCNEGACRVSCVTGLTDCAGSCRDLQTDRNHCGACGMACPSGQVCAAGRCEVSCLTGFTACGGACVNLQSDNANCGACGMACPSGQVCNGGRCAASCGAGLTACSGDCTSTRFDPQNCGACGTVCGPYDNAAASCSAGSCVQTCASGFADCNADRADGCERNLAADLAHCGRCGVACPSRSNATSTCAAGACGFTCLPNFADCDGNPNNGCEADLRTSVAHCGRCDAACSPANGVGQCTAGACGVLRCNGTFQNCDNNPANGCEHDTRTTCNSCDLGCRDRSVGTGGNPYAPGGQTGTAVDPSGGLIVSGMSSTTVSDFLWIVNTAESTMSKWDATGQRELARYRVGLSTGECRGLCCYNNGCNMPSRVVVDGNADAYVASRGFAFQGSVTKIAAERANCVDRNNNGMIETSSGPSDVLAYGADECVLWTANVGANNAVLRAITVDRGDVTHPYGYVWVGGYNTRQAFRLNPRTGAVLNTYTLGLSPYGFVVTRDGRLWASTLDQGLLQSINTVTLAVENTVAYPRSLRLSGTCANSYGLTADGRGRIWIAGWDCRDALGYDPAIGQWTRVDTTSLVGGTSGRGITVDASGRVWMAYATTSDGPSGGLLSWDSNDFAAGVNIAATRVRQTTLPGGYSGPSAIGVDRVGNVWLAHYQAPSALVRYTPATNASVVLFGANQVYSYSDFTGSVRRTTIAQGSYEETIDLGCEAPTLTTFRWTATTPAGTSITFAGRTAATTVGIGAAASVTVALAPRDASPVDLAAAFRAAGVTPARQFRLSVSMQSSDTGATPILQSFNVGWRCPAP